MTNAVKKYFLFLYAQPYAAKFAKRRLPADSYKNGIISDIRQVGGYNKLQELDVVDEKAAVIYFQTDSIRITNPQSAPLHIDGDPVESAEVFNIRLLKHCFRLIYP